MHQWPYILRVEAPTDSIVTVDEVKSQTNIAHDDSDEYLEHLIRVATASVETPNGAGIPLLTATWRMQLDAFPDVIEIPMTPLREIVSITYNDLNGASQTIAADDYIVDLDSARIYCAPGKTWPETLDIYKNIKITFVCGYGDEPSDVPADLRHAILLLIAHYERNREGTSETDLKDIPFGIKSILNRYAPIRLG